MDGAELGASEGDADALGLAEGLLEGVTLGVDEGLAVGLLEGKADGLAVGLLVGLALGLLDGLDEGLELGLVVSQGIGYHMASGLVWEKPLAKICNSVFWSPGPSRNLTMTSSGLYFCVSSTILSRARLSALPAPGPMR